MKDKLKFKGASKNETNDQSYYSGMINLYGYMQSIGYDFKKDDFIREKMRFALEEFNKLENERRKKREEICEMWRQLEQVTGQSYEYPFLYR